MKKNLILALATAAAVVAVAVTANAPGPPVSTDVQGTDPAIGCVSDSECRTYLSLIGWPGKGHRAHASIAEMSVGNGGHAFRGDRRLLTTISPNGDGLRDRAAIRFRLTAPATVKLIVTRTATHARVLRVQTRRLAAGRHTMYWAPPADQPPRTYLTYLAVHDAAGWRMYGSRNGNPRLRQQTPVVRVLGVDAAFRGESYSQGDYARLSVSTDARRVTLQILRSGPERVASRRPDELNGIPVTEPVTFDWRRHRSAPQTLGVWIGGWPTGMYFARLETGDGRVGFAPFVVRPANLGEHRVGVVMPTYTWQAYNLRDGDGNGWGETWYVHQVQRTIRLGRPYLDRGVPMAYHLYDLPFLHWLAWTDRPVDYLAQRDIARSSGSALRRAYDLLIFPGHHEYVTRDEFDAVAAFRNRGGNLMFLSANNFFWRIDRRGSRLQRVQQWRKLGRPEASLIGIQYVANGRRRGPYTVTDATSASWLFSGTGLTKGSTFGNFGTEVDRTGPSSPRGTRVLAEIPNLFGRGRGAQMTYYETREGARVFAAGAFTLAGSAARAHGLKLLDNLWRRMAELGAVPSRRRGLVHH